MAGALMLSILLISRRKGYGGYRRPATPIEIARSFRDSIWAMFMPISLVGGNRFGVFTPTERRRSQRATHGGHDSHLPETSPPAAWAEPSRRRLRTRPW